MTRDFDIDLPQKPAKAWPYVFSLEYGGGHTPTICLVPSGKSISSPIFGTRAFLQGAGFWRKGALRALLVAPACRSGFLLIAIYR
jgi:hypothetical protein